MKEEWKGGEERGGVHPIKTYRQAECTQYSEPKGENKEKDICWVYVYEGFCGLSYNSFAKKSHLLMSNKTS